MSTAAAAAASFTAARQQ